MKKFAALVLIAVFGLAPSAFAGMQINPGQQPQKATLSFLEHYDHHPLSQPVSTADVKIAVNSDIVLRSCCMTNLMVRGTVTNISATPIDYVKLLLTFENSKGNVVYVDHTYNHRAVTLFEDPAIARALKETRHFTPLQPGQSDTFEFSIPYYWLPMYTKVQLLAGAVVRNLKVATAH